jgi:hypothetical protein
VDQVSGDAVARAVAAFLEAHGIPASSLAIVGHGSSDLVADAPRAPTAVSSWSSRNPPAGDHAGSGLAELRRIRFSGRTEHLNLRSVMPRLGSAPDIRLLAPDEWVELRNIRLAALRESRQAFLSNYQREIVYDPDRWRAEFGRGRLSRSNTTRSEN